jgi:hypothetical protein
MPGDKFEYGSRFLYAEDLLHGGEFKRVRVEIAAYHAEGTMKAATGKTIDKPVIRFKDRDKMLVLCKSNRSMITTVTGEQPGPNWIGKVVNLEVREVPAFGEQVLAIRVMPTNGTVIRKRLKEMLGVKAVFKKEGQS